MRRGSSKPMILSLAVLAVLLVLIGLAYRGAEEGAERGRGGERAIPVEVAGIRSGPIALQRTFNGSLVPAARYTVAPKVSGRIRQLLVDLADPVAKGEAVVQLEADEFELAVVEAKTRVKVAEANRNEAVKSEQIARRNLERVQTLHERGIASDTDLDSAEAAALASEAAVAVADARHDQEQAALDAAQVRLGYTRIVADWEGDTGPRLVSARHVDEGDTVSANTALLELVDLDPLLAVIQVSERDYPRVAAGQAALLRVDALPDQVFTGTVARVAPAFQEDSRQARVEVSIPNATRQLKPGMFARITLTLAREAEALAVPEAALLKRRGSEGVFLVNDAGAQVRWQPVTPGACRCRLGECGRIAGGGGAGRRVGATVPG
jgi:RND family efflux transporter MFP subunit